MEMNLQDLARCRQTSKLRSEISKMNLKEKSPIASKRFNYFLLVRFKESRVKNRSSCYNVLSVLLRLRDEVEGILCSYSTDKEVQTETKMP